MICSQYKRFGEDTIHTTKLISFSLPTSGIEPGICSESGSEDNQNSNTVTILYMN